jgi:hypothetical protein
MAEFKTKKQVFLEFGVPNDQITMDSITSFTYTIGTQTQSSSFSIGNTNYSGTYSNRTVYSGSRVSTYNPYYQVSTSNYIYNGTAISTYSTIGSSQTTNRYIKFWMMQDSVLKWETLGYNRERKVPNPEYDENIALAMEEAAKAVKKYNNQIAMKRLNTILIVGFITFVGIMVAAFSI